MTGKQVLQAMELYKALNNLAEQMGTEEFQFSIVINPESDHDNPPGTVMVDSIQPTEPNGHMTIVRDNFYEAIHDWLNWE